MSSDNIHIFDKIEDLHKGFTAFIIELLSEKERISISLSGGETPKGLFDYWANEDKSIDWSRIDFYWGDERCVPPTDSESNYGMTKKHLLDKIAASESQVFRIIGENNPAEEAVRYGELLDANLPSENGIPQFDLVILGLGIDGHTVSIFPHQIELWGSPANCVVAQHPGSGQNRISLTGKVVNNAVQVAFLTTGSSKREKVRSIIENSEAFSDRYPAAHVNPSSGNLHWFIDQEAGRLL
ncbi:MAG: 6-phosphogluconolactonase [Bacteroidales bacterium 45-6]|nr:MAG: 6-phosphogluconolactonase [Bacteroidales bacterium 45-6]